MFDGRYVKLDQNPGVVTAYDHEIERLAGVEVQLLMGHIGCEVHEIAGTHFCSEFEPHSPTYLAPTLYDIDRNLVTAMVMRPRLRIRRRRQAGTGGIRHRAASVARLCG